jgi:hypothetical protein
LNVHKVSDVRQIEIHTAELLVPNPTPFEVEIVITKLKRYIRFEVFTAATMKNAVFWDVAPCISCKSYNLPGSDQIPAELIQEGGEILRSNIHKLINLFGIRKNFLISGKSLLLYQFIRRAIKLTVVIIVVYHCHQLRTKFYPIFFS